MDAHIHDGTLPDGCRINCPFQESCVREGLRDCPMWQKPKMLAHFLSSLLMHGVALFLVFSIPIYVGDKSTKFTSGDFSHKRDEARNITDQPGTEVMLLASETTGRQKPLQSNIKPKIPKGPSVGVKRILSVSGNLPKNPVKADVRETAPEHEVPVKRILGITDVASNADKPLTQVHAEIRVEESVQDIPGIKTADSSGEVAVVQDNTKKEPEAGASSSDNVAEPEKSYQIGGEKEKAAEPTLPEPPEPLRATNDKEISDKNPDVVAAQEASGPDVENIASEQTVSPKAPSFLTAKESRETEKAFEPDVEQVTEPQVSPKSSELAAATEEQSPETTTNDEKEVTAPEERHDPTSTSSPDSSSITALVQLPEETHESDKELTSPEEDIFKGKDMSGIVLLPNDDMAVKEDVEDIKSGNTRKAHTKSHIVVAPTLKKEITLGKVKRIPGRKVGLISRSTVESVPAAKADVSEELRYRRLASDIRHALEPFIKNPAEPVITGEISQGGKDKDKEKQRPAILDGKLAGDIRHALKPFLDNPVEQLASRKRTASLHTTEKEEIKEKKPAEKAQKEKQASAILDGKLAGDIRRALKPFLDNPVEQLAAENKELNRKRPSEKEHSEKPVFGVIRPEEEKRRTAQSEAPPKYRIAAVGTISVNGLMSKERSFPELEDVVKGKEGYMMFPSFEDLLFRNVWSEPTHSVTDVEVPVTETINIAETKGTGQEKVSRQDESREQKKENETENLSKKFIGTNQSGASMMPRITDSFLDLDRIFRDRLSAGTEPAPEPLTDILTEQAPVLTGSLPLLKAGDERDRDSYQPDRSARKIEERAGEEGPENITVADSMLATSESPALGIPVPASMLANDIMIELVLLDEEDAIIENKLMKRELPVRVGRRRGHNEQVNVKFDEDTVSLSSPTVMTRKISVANADKGIYTFIIKNPNERDQEIDIVFRLYDGGPNSKVKEYKAKNIPGHGELIYKFVLPHAVFWDDDDYFSGSIEGSDTITKFNDETGLVWEEEKK
jgi:hypothetical protein